MMDAYRWTGIAARELGFADAPLSAEQADQLAQILANNSAIYQSDQALNRASVDGNASIASVDWNTALTEAKAVLSVTQWKSAEPVFLNFQFEGALEPHRSKPRLAAPPVSPGIEAVRRRTWIVAFAGITFALALGVKWWGGRSEREAEASLVEVGRRRAELDAGIRRAEEGIAASDRDRLALQAALRASPPAASPLAGPAKSNPGSPDVAALLEANPALFALGVRAYRANLGPHFAPLYRKLGLSQTQIGAFEDLMTEHEEEVLDLNATASSQGIENSDPAVLAVRQQEDDQLHAAQIALLGAAGYQQLQQFARAEPVQEIVASVATTVALTSTPLSGAQATELRDFLANSSSSYRSGDPADPATIDWDVALPQAQGILNNPQFGALKAESLKLQVEKIQAQFDQQESGPENF